MSNFEHLMSNCKGPCDCQEPVRMRADGRWFITMGHSGFNSPANNRHGYGSKESAVAAFKRYQKKGAAKPSCYKCGLSFQNHWLKDGQCNGCRNPHLIVTAVTK